MLTGKGRRFHEYDMTETGKNSSREKAYALAGSKQKNTILRHGSGCDKLRMKSRNKGREICL